MTRARDLADGALYKITPSTSGNVLTSDGSNWTSSSNPTELPAHGTNGNVLTSNGSAWTSATPAPADLVNDTSPQLGADLDMQSHSISSGVLPVKNTGSAPSELRLYCESSNAHYVGLKSPAHSAFSGNHVITMPPNTGTSGQFLSTDGNGVTSWGDAGGGSRTLISNTDLTGVSTISRTADFSTSYSAYEVELRQFKVSYSSGFTYGRMHLIDDQGTQVGGNYTHKTAHASYNLSDYHFTAETGAQVYFGLNRQNAGTLKAVGGRYYNFRSTISDPNKTIKVSSETLNVNANIIWGSTDFWGQDEGGDTRWYNGYFYNNSQTRRVTGIKFSLNDGTFTAGRLIIWGVGS